MEERHGLVQGEERKSEDDAVFEVFMASSLPQLRSTAESRPRRRYGRLYFTRSV